MKSTKKNTKLLCILHLPPPAHGAAKVGEFIKNSRIVNETFQCRFIPIKSSETIGEIGKINVKKFYYFAELYLKVLWALLIFRPDKIYFTASIKSVAFYRDLLLSTLWKTYKKIKKCDVFYHYHTKGINDFVSVSQRNLKLTRFFSKDINLILLSPLLEEDVRQVRTFQSINFLPNGIEDPLKNENFDEYVRQKYGKIERLEILYLAHMMKDKGYDEVLELARQNRGKNIHFHFAGSWQSGEDEKFFNDFVKKHGLEKNVTYHGFVGGEQKAALFKKAHLLVYPSKNDAFPLTLPESLAYGVPVMATPQGSIPYILDEKSGIVFDADSDISVVFKDALEKLIIIHVARDCRNRFLDNFTQEKFEKKFIRYLISESQ